MKEHNFAYSHAGPATPLDKIIARDGPYLKFWFGSSVEVLDCLTKRDASHVKESRATIFKSRDGIVHSLSVNDQSMKWKKVPSTVLKLK